MVEDRFRAFFRDALAKYGITEREYRVLYRAQGGRCYVCRTATGPTKQNPRARMLGIDHDHLTGEVRGLVCTGSLNANTCNRLIAIYNRSQLLRAAAMLSDPPPARGVLGPLRAGAELVPSLVDDAMIVVADVKGVTG